MIFSLRVLISLGFITECENETLRRQVFPLACCSICGFAPLSFNQATVGDREMVLDMWCILTITIGGVLKSLSATEIEVRQDPTRPK